MQMLNWSLEGNGKAFFKLITSPNMDKRSSQMQLWNKMNTKNKVWFSIKQRIKHGQVKRTYLFLSPQHEFSIWNYDSKELTNVQNEAWRNSPSLNEMILGQIEISQWYL